MKSMPFNQGIPTIVSTRIKNLSFLLIIQVVFIHAYRPTWNVNPHGFDKFNYFIQYLISQEICRSAVPLFFIISGYLFFIGYKATAKWLFEKWQRRISSLMVPYLLWSLIGIVSFFVMQSIPSTTHFFTHKLLKDYTLFDFLKTLLWQPVPYQLWFIRYLFLYILLAPVMYFVCQKFYSVLVLVVVTALLLIFPVLVHYHFIEWFSYGAVLYYMGFYLLGNFLSINNNKIRLTPLSTSEQAIFFLIWLTLCFTETYLKIALHLTMFGLHDLTIFIGIYCMWILADSTGKCLNKMNFSILSSYAFFVFAAHEPLLTILIKCGNYLVRGQSSLVYLILYFLCPIITIMTSISAAILLSRHFPKIYMRLTGYR